MLRRRLLGLALAGALALLTGTACSAGGPDGAPASGPDPTTATPSEQRTIVITPPPPPEGLHLSFIQQRIDEGTRRAQVRVVNGFDPVLHVRSVGVDWAGYPGRRQRVDYDVPGRQTVDLRYLLPRADCARAALRAPMRGVVVTDRGVRRRPLEEDGVRFLTRLWSSECNARRLDRAVTVGYAERWTRRGDTLTGSIGLVRRRGERPVTLTQVEGSVLYDLSAPPTTLAAGRDRTSVPLVVRDGGRCDPHSRGQSTQTFLFRIWLRLGEGPELARVLPPPRPLQRRLLAFLDDVCAGRG